jgi:hypothetical protein
MSEAAHQSQVVQLATLLGYKVFHVSDSRRPGPNGSLVGDRLASGFPDLVLVGNGKVLFRELKTARGVVKPNQQEWLDVLVQNGADAAVWRPQDWNLIQAQLRS